MNARDAIKAGMAMADQISLGYLEDLSDAEMLKRPCAGCNHINWQVGHLIASENGMMSSVAPGTMPPLPDGFAAKYTKETSTIDDAKKFSDKAELLKVFKEQRAATLAILDKQTDADFDKPSGMSFAPTRGDLFSMQGSHWLMHAGQWAVVRRQLGRKPLF